MQVSVYVNVAFSQVAADQCFVLLAVVAANHQIIFRADKPQKLFKPVALAGLDDAGHHLRTTVGRKERPLSPSRQPSSRTSFYSTSPEIT